METKRYLSQHSETASVSTTLHIGIDPGKDGAWAIVYPHGEIEYHVFSKIGDEVDISDLNNRLKAMSQKVRHCVIEDVHSIFGASAKANFQFGRIVGVLETLLICNHIPFTKVAPKAWQKVMHEGIPKMTKAGKTSSDTKAMSLVAAKRIYPNETFLATERSKVPHDGIVDAALMAKYSQLRHSF